MHYQTEWAGNWKLSAENSMEYYHHVGLHKDTVGGQLPAKNTYLPASPEDGSFTHERCRMDDAYIGGEEHPNIAEERRELILKVNEEDAKATTELAKVMRSSKAQRGPLSPFEGTLVEFYRYLARSLLDQNGSSP